MKCPQCKQAIDNVLAIEKDSKPKENDLIICTVCYGINTFDKDLNIIKADDYYVNSIPESMRIEINTFIEDLKQRRSENNAKLN